MNAALRAALEGKRVAVIAGNAGQLRCTHRAMMLAAPELDATRSAGREAIATPAGGLITFHPARTFAERARGYRFDEVYITGDVTMTRGIYQAVYWSTLTSAGPAEVQVLA